MAINVNQAFSGQRIRAPAAADSLASQRANSQGEVQASAGPTELPQSGRPGETIQGRIEEAVAAAMDPKEPEGLDRAIEEANSLAEATMRATNRSVTFGRDEPTGRVVITIREEKNGEEISRQIPPAAFLKLVERLREAREGEAPAGGLIDFKL